MCVTIFFKLRIFFRQNGSLTSTCIIHKLEFVHAFKKISQCNVHNLHKLKSDILYSICKFIDTVYGRWDALVMNKTEQST